MNEFSPTIARFWNEAAVGATHRREGTGFTLLVNPSIAYDRRVTLLRRPDGHVTAAVTPEVADSLVIETFTEQGFRSALKAAAIPLHDPDNIYYFAEGDRRDLLAESAIDAVRQLTESDAELFAEFESSNTEQDLDDAFVELEHWAVFGSLSEGRLVSAASAYPWGESQLADLGVLSLPEVRGRGHARAVVRALARHVYAQGYEPQYRSQLDNEGSIALAASAGLTLFGTWHVVSPDA